MQVLRPRPAREAADCCRHLGIVAPHMLTRAGEGNSIEQSQEVCAQSFEKGGLVWVSAGKARSFPLLELALGDAEHRLNCADPERLSERVLALLSHQVDLVPEGRAGSC